MASKCEVAASTITRALNGDRQNLSVDLAQKVEKATGGALTAEGFMASCLRAVKAKAEAKPDTAGEAAA
ncbi:hypothetical protein F8B91_11690 [Aestuariivirga litoralis]|nr:hypothetical protein [Aestuariivirga litoralis]